jgi:copper resistance protein C
LVVERDGGALKRANTRASRPAATPTLRLFWWLVVLVLGVGGAASALAHAELLVATPRPGETFQWERPAEVRLEFTQELQPTGNRILVTDRNFRAVQQGEAQVNPADPFTLQVALGDLSAGGYTVNWHSVSVDGHSLDGAYEFTILPREPLVTMVVAGVVLTGMGLLVFFRRARPDDLDA